MRLMEQQPTQQYSRNSYVVWNIQQVKNYEQL